MTMGIKMQTLINRIAQLLEFDHIHMIGIKYQAGKNPVDILFAYEALGLETKNQTLLLL
jgi:hypothetical protein